jgi:response regulator of citrate/malate metabolism
MGFTVLIIDGDEDDQELFREVILQIAPATQFQVALSAGDALHSLNNNDPPDLILLDAYLYDRNSLDFLQEIKVNEKLKAIPVVMMDTLYSERMESEVLQSGAAGYYLKPVFFTEAKSLFKIILQKMSEK